MTILAALACSSFSLLLADRRVSENGSLIDDEFNKVCVLVCDDARVAMAFTGLATLPGFNTSEWIAEQLNDIGSTTGALHDILAELARRAEQCFARLYASDRRLSILIAGYAHWSVVPQPVAYVLSNFEHGQNPVSGFTLRFISPDEGAIVELAGNTNALAQDVEVRLRRLLRANLDAASVLRSAVKLLRVAARSSRSGYAIGEQYNSAIIRSKVDTTITTTYHSNFHSHVAYGPNVVITQGIIVLGYEVFSATVLAGKDIRKNDPCWCGSSERFKHCHMKKFGAVYVSHAAFKRPMYAVVSMTSDVQRASGKAFCVASGYA